MKKTVVAVATLAILAAVAVAAFGGAAHGISATDLQADIKKDLTKQIHAEPDGETVTVKTMECVIRNETSARCAAKLHDSNPDAPITDKAVTIKVTFDKDDGSYLWETEA
jgi:hypothetical protein